MGTRMKILIACEESQEICKAFRAKGHEAYSCDLQECSGGHPEWHIKADVTELINPTMQYIPGDNWVGFLFKTQNGDTRWIEGKWDLIIAHPPCTYMSKASARWMYQKGSVCQERLDKALEAKEFFMKFYEADCPRIAIENPIPLKIVGLPQCDQIIEPYDFGEPYSKKTCLWLKGLTPLLPTDVYMEYIPFLPSNTGGGMRGQHTHKGAANKKDSRTRSKTFKGIAKAMADQWSDI